MPKRTKKKDKNEKPIGPANPESGGGSTGNQRSPAEEKLREEFDKNRTKRGERQPPKWR